MATRRGTRTVRPFVYPNARSLARAGAHTAFAAHAYRRADWRKYRDRYNWYAWAGPVFWPYAYDDLFDDIFWGYGGFVYLDDLFWDYGYGDIYAALFWPYGFDDYYGYESYAYEPPSRRGRHAGSVRAAAVLHSWAPLCGDDNREIADLPIDRIRKIVKPDEKQQAALNELASAMREAAQVIKTACPTEFMLTPTGRLRAIEQRLQAMAKAADIVRTPLGNFYDSLSDEQKARVNAVAQSEDNRRRGRRPLAHVCNAPAVTEWPEARIAQIIRPSESQRTNLLRLKDAAASAAEMLKADCATELAETPPGRLAAVSKRINTMLRAARTVYGALNEFYGSLSDEQKARFNRLGQELARSKE